MNIQLVSVNQIDGVWPAVRGHIEKAISKCDDLTVSGMYGFCRSGKGFLFVSDDLKAAAIAGFDEMGGKEVARIYAMGSAVHTDWSEAIQSIKKFAKANGAEKVIFQGRKGWARVFGVKPKFYYYEV